MEPDHLTFIATAVRRHHADKFKQDYPQASQCINHAFYVDDLLTGTETVEEAAALFSEVCQLLLKCGMVLRKLRTNSPELRSSVPDHLIEMADLEITSQDQPLKTLGIHSLERPV